MPSTLRLSYVQVRAMRKMAWMSRVRSTGWYLRACKKKTETHLFRRHVRVHLVHFVLYRFRLTVPVVFLDAQVLLDLVHAESHARAIRSRGQREDATPLHTWAAVHHQRSDDGHACPNVRSSYRTQEYGQQSTINFGHAGLKCFPERPGSRTVQKHSERR